MFSIIAAGRSVLGLGDRGEAMVAAMMEGVTEARTGARFRYRIHKEGQGNAITGRVSTMPYVGIDVSKDFLDLSVGSEGNVVRYANAPDGHTEIVIALESLQAPTVIIEATGCYHTAIAPELASQGIAVAIVNPRQVRDFARATGQLAKTDVIDSRVLVAFGEAVKPEPRPLPDAESQALTELVTRHRQLVDMMTAEKNRLRNASAGVKSRIEAHIKWLAGQLKDVDSDIDGAITRNCKWAKKARILRSVPGVGPAVSRVLIADLPELGTLDRKRIAACRACSFQQG